MSMKPDPGPTVVEDQEDPEVEEEGPILVVAEAAIKTGRGSE